MQIPEDFPYREQLLILTKHQQQRDYPVRYQFVILSGDDRHELIVHALNRTGDDDEDPSPILAQPNYDLLVLGERRRLIEIVQGSIKQEHGVFVLNLEPAKPPQIQQVANISGGADLNAQGDSNIGGDVVGRDKIESASGHIIHAGPGAIVVVNEPGAAAPPRLPRDFDEALQRYRQRMRDHYSTTRLLGQPEPVPLDGIFTDVNLLDHPTALQRYTIEELEAAHARRAAPQDKTKRISAVEVANQHNRLFILGKPGAGKTTFLRYLTFQAATGALERLPIFVSLNEWAASGLDLLPFIEQQFAIHGFPDATVFIQQLLKRGGALVCFDGLDEVREADDKRATLTPKIVNFTNQYPDNKHLITCRIAATDYVFEKFTYVEMADFTPEQIQVFASKWFGRDDAKAQRFVDELKRQEHRGLQELAQTPLLLTLLCLTFETKLTFPARRVDIYKEALNVLLNRWDGTHKTQRDVLYGKLSLSRKKELLSQLACLSFASGKYFLPEDWLARRIEKYLQQLSSPEPGDVPDGAAVLHSIQAQHGILVEAAHGIYSFAHLSFQEYFMALYIVENSTDDEVKQLIVDHLTDNSWREVILLTASLLENADQFFELCHKGLEKYLRDKAELIRFLSWANEKAIAGRNPTNSARASFLLGALAAANAAAVQEVGSILGSGLKFLRG